MHFVLSRELRKHHARGDGLDIPGFGLDRLGVPYYLLYVTPKL